MTFKRLKQNLQELIVFNLVQKENAKINQINWVEQKKLWFGARKKYKTKRCNQLISTIWFLILKFKNIPFWLKYYGGSFVSKFFSWWTL